jgi:hypothetical protein
MLWPSRGHHQVYLLEFSHHFGLGWDWKPFTWDEIHVLLAIFMLMGIDQKPTLWSYFSKNSFGNSCIWVCNINGPIWINMQTYALQQQQSYISGPSTTFQNIPSDVLPNRKFWTLHIENQNIATDGSLTLWKWKLSNNTFHWSHQNLQLSLTSFVNPAQAISGPLLFIMEETLTSEEKSRTAVVFSCGTTGW